MCSFLIGTFSTCQRSNGTFGSPPPPSGIKRHSISASHFCKSRCKFTMSCVWRADIAMILLIAKQWKGKINCDNCALCGRSVQLKSFANGFTRLNIVHTQLIHGQTSLGCFQNYAYFFPRYHDHSIDIGAYQVPGMNGNGWILRTSGSWSRRR